MTQPLKRLFFDVFNEELKGTNNYSFCISKSDRKCPENLHRPIPHVYKYLKYLRVTMDSFSLYPIIPPTGSTKQNKKYKQS